MRAEFLLKSLDGIGNRKYITDYQIGRSNTNMHWHDCIEMVYVEKGNMKIFLTINGMKFPAENCFLFLRKDFII